MKMGGKHTLHLWQDVLHPDVANVRIEIPRRRQFTIGKWVWERRRRDMHEDQMHFLRLMVHLVSEADHLVALIFQTIGHVVILAPEKLGRGEIGGGGVCGRKGGGGDPPNPQRAVAPWGGGPPAGGGNFLKGAFQTTQGHSREFST